MWIGLNVQKNRVFLIYKKLIGRLHKVAQEWGEASDMGMGREGWRGSGAAEPRYGGALITGEPAFSSDMGRICEKIDGDVRWENRPGCALDGRKLPL